MFDPNHNAVAKDYYLVNGPLTGSWEGLDKDVIIVPWYFAKRAESLKFFADRGHQQVIAGYYDAKPERIKEWLDAATRLERCHRRDVHDLAKQLHRPRSFQPRGGCERKLSARSFPESDSD